MPFFKKNQICRTINNEKGFSLIEVLIAVSVLAVGLLAISSLSISASNSNGRSTRYTQAAVLAEEQVETLLNTPYDTMGDSGGPSVVDSRYTITWSAETRDANMKDVTVTVTWPEGDIQKNISLTFVKHD